MLRIAIAEVAQALERYPRNRFVVGGGDRVAVEPGNAGEIALEHARDSRGTAVCGDIGVGAGAAQDPCADADNDAGFFRQLDEVAGRDEPAPWMPPAHQRFGAHCLFRIHIDKRLEKEIELLAINRQTQVGFQDATLLGLGVHFLLEEAEGRAETLRGIE